MNFTPDFVNGLGIGTVLVSGFFVILVNYKLQTLVRFHLDERARFYKEGREHGYKERINEERSARMEQEIVDALMRPAGRIVTIPQSNVGRLDEWPADHINEKPKSH